MIVFLCIIVAELVLAFGFAFWLAAKIRKGREATKYWIDYGSDDSGYPNPPGP